MVSQSHAPKCNRTRVPSSVGQFAGTSNVRRYQSRFFSVTFVITPERADSGGNGTRICCEKTAGLLALVGVKAKSQSPFKLSQLLRTICGRGYSESAFAGETS